MPTRLAKQGLTLPWLERMQVHKAVKDTKGKECTKEISNHRSSRVAWQQGGTSPDEVLESVQAVLEKPEFGDMSAGGDNIEGCLYISEIWKVEVET